MGFIKRINSYPSNKERKTSVKRVDISDVPDDVQQRVRSKLVKDRRLAKHLLNKVKKSGEFNIVPGTLSRQSLSVISEVESILAHTEVHRTPNIPYPSRRSTMASVRKIQSDINRRSSETEKIRSERYFKVDDGWDI